MKRTWLNRNRKTSPTEEAEETQEAPAAAVSQHAQGSSIGKNDLVNKDSTKKLIIKLKPPHAQGSSGSRDDLVNQDSAANVGTRSGREASSFSQHSQGSSISRDDFVNQVQ